MLAAARKADAQGGAAATPPPKRQPRRSSAEATPAAEKPARARCEEAGREPAADSRASPTCWRWLAARKQAARLHRPRRKKSRPPKPAPRAKAAPAKKEAAAAKAEPVDTQSILAAARKARSPAR